MQLKTFRKKVYNSLAFRVNKFADYVKPKFTIKLNGKTFTIPVIGTLGEINVYQQEDWFFRLVKSFNLPADVDIVDVGLNVGQSLLAIKSCYNNTYWGFEPNPTCVFYLERLIKANSIRNANILPVGLFASDKVLKLYVHDEHNTDATLLGELKPKFFNLQKTKHVPVFCFENLTLQAKKIGFVKIDVEGAELEVISGMLQTITNDRPIVVCEILDYATEESREKEQERAAQLVHLLKKIDYKMYRVIHRSDLSLTFEELQSFELKKLEPRSLNENDYLFLPEPIAEFSWMRESRY